MQNLRNQSGQTVLEVMPSATNHDTVLSSHAPALVIFDPLLNYTSHFTRSRGLGRTLPLWGSSPPLHSTRSHGLPL